MDIPLFSTPMTSAPISAPKMVPLPVAGEAPPMKQAAMASPSKPFPIMVEQEFILAVNTIPAIAARTDMFR